MEKYAKIQYIGGIEGSDRKSPDFQTLTGSCTKLDIDGHIGLIDFGMHQGGKNDQEKNKTLPDSIGEIQYVYLTHSHLDHSGRLPFLVKNGYDGPIYCTKLTGEQAIQLWYDSIKIVRSEQEKIKKINSFNSEEFKKNKFLVENYESLENSNLSVRDRERIKNKLFKKFGTSELYELEDKYFEAKKYLEENPKNEILKQVELLYDEKDVEKTISQLKYIDMYKDLNLSENFSGINSELSLEKLLEQEAFNLKEDILLPIETFNDIREELEEYIKNTKLALDENNKIYQKNKGIKEKFIEVIDFLNDENNKNLAIYFDYQKELEDYGINDIFDIEKTLEDYYEINYSLDELYSLKKKLKIIDEKNFDFEKDLVRKISSKGIKAGHIEGSEQIIFSTIIESSKKVIDVLEGKLNSKIPGFHKKTKRHKNFLFSGDLGRSKNQNLPGIPDIYGNKLDYVQVESTYAGRLHENREVIEQQLFDEIKEAKGTVLIPAFSIQRTQEVLVLLVGEMQKNIKYKNFADETKEEIKSLEKEFNEIKYKNLRRAEQIEKALNILKYDLKSYNKNISFHDIIVDSPLSSRITKIYLDEPSISKKYEILKPEKQIEIFGREVIRFVKDKDEQKTLYENKNNRRKRVIVSSGGMVEGGAILYHLPHILTDKEAKIIFIGYCPETTNGGKIKKREKIFIDGQYFDVNCEIADLNGFSAHPDQEEIIDYIKSLNLKTGAIIALTHGNENREILAKAIEEEMEKIGKKIKIIIPNIGDEISIKL